MKLPKPATAVRIAVASAWTGSLASVALTTTSLGIWAGDHVMPRVWLSVVLRIFGIRVEAFGTDNINQAGQYVFVSNHTSVLDGMALVVTTKRMPRFVGKNSIRKIPVVGVAWEKLGHVLIDRKDPQQAYGALAEATRNERDEYSFYVSPEGTRFNDNGVGDFKRGAFVLAHDLGVPVVPVAVLGADDLWQAGTWDIKSGLVRIYYGKPITVKDPDEAALVAKQWIEQTIQDQVDG